MRPNWTVVPAGLVLAGALLVAPSVALAQDDMEEEPVIHYITTTTFDLPTGDARGVVMEYIDEVWAPGAKMDPNVLSFRVATHNWGANSNQAIMIYEYADFASINATCDACDDWYDSQEPEEDTPEREAWDEREEIFFKAYAGHDDQIYASNMSRAK